ncbi:MAG: class I SAM-dependent methyltransferase [Candidatus Woesearchaeota archaeon]
MKKNFPLVFRKQFMQIEPGDYNDYISTLFPQYKLFLNSAAKTVIEHIKTLEQPKIVDLGCGTGNLEAELDKILPFNYPIRKVIRGIDNDWLALLYAGFRTEIKHTEWYWENIPDFEFFSAQVYTSSLTLHHLNGNWEEAFEKIYRALPPGGIFVQTEMVKGETEAEQQKYSEQIKNNLEPRFNFEDWKKESDQVDHFHTIGKELYLLCKLGFKVDIIQEDPPFYQYLAQK